MTSYCNLTADNSTVHKLVTQHLFIKFFFFPFYWMEYLCYTQMPAIYKSRQSVLDI